jgi:hypothetical protein
VFCAFLSKKKVVFCACVRYLAAKSEADHYNRELQREQDEIDTVPDVGKQRNRAVAPRRASPCTFFSSDG